MSKKNVEELLIKGGEDKKFRAKYDSIIDKETFVSTAKEQGFDFTVTELESVLAESGDTFETYGNPPKRSIWWT